jgi:hypothetical protein
MCDCWNRLLFSCLMLLEEHWTARKIQSYKSSSTVKNWRHFWMVERERVRDPLRPWEVTLWLNVRVGRHSSVSPPPSYIEGGYNPAVRLSQHLMITSLFFSPFVSLAFFLWFSFLHTLCWPLDFFHTHFHSLSFSSLSFFLLWGGGMEEVRLNVFNNHGNQ